MSMTASQMPRAKLWLLILVNGGVLLAVAALIWEVVFQRMNKTIPDIVLAHLQGSTESILNSGARLSRVLIVNAVRGMFGLAFINLAIYFDLVRRLWDVFEKRKESLNPTIANVFFYLSWTILGVIMSKTTGISLASVEIISQNMKYLLKGLLDLSEKTCGGCVGGDVGNLLVILILNALVVGFFWTKILSKYRVMYFPLQAISWVVYIALALQMANHQLLSISRPLPEGKVRTALEALAIQNGFNPDNLHEWPIANAGTLSTLTGSHIYVCREEAFKWTVEEFSAVTGHELGHWKHHDIWVRVGVILALQFSWMAPFLWLISNPAIYAAFGLSSEPLIVGIAILEMFESAVSRYIPFFTLLLDRIQEYRADGYSKDLGYPMALSTSLVKMAQTVGAPVSFSYPFEYRFLDHPSIERRLEALSQKST